MGQECSPVTSQACLLHSECYSSISILNSFLKLPSLRKWEHWKVMTTDFNPFSPSSALPFLVVWTCGLSHLFPPRRLRSYFHSSFKEWFLSPLASLFLCSVSVKFVYLDLILKTSWKYLLSKKKKNKNRKWKTPSPVSIALVWFIIGLLKWTSSSHIFSLTKFVLWVG